MTVTPADGAADVTLHVWRVAPRDVPRTVVRARRAAARMRRDGAAFAKVLGTSSAAFLPTRATPTRWALLTTSTDVRDGTLPWTALARETATLSLRPLRVRGRWDGRQPFGDSPAGVDAWTGPVVAVTRATLRATRAARFYRSVPPVATALRQTDGCRVAFGIGESPVLRQGTVSVWESASAMREFAHTSPAHVAVVRATPEQRWYAEELFARFALVGTTGTIDGTALS